MGRCRIRERVIARSVETGGTRLYYHSAGMVGFL